ncbi:MAG: methyltransferase domain-containing protein [Candidatus Promineifilaceae bacterium]
MSEKVEWHQDDEFWTEMAPFIFGQDAWEISPEQLSRALELMKIESVGSILDLACGPGRHSLELARRGFQVTGVDRTDAYLDEARNRAKNEDLVIEFVQEDMRRFVRPDAYDGALSMFTSFGYFELPSDNQQVLLNVYHSLKEGSAFFMDMVGREILARNFQSRDWREVEGTLLLEDRLIERNWTIMRNRRILIKDNKRTEFMITHWLYSGAELIELLKESGFKSVELYGDLDGSPYDHEAKRLLAVARK